jgi:hypothetical protein
MATKAETEHKLPHLRGSDSARRYGRAPKVHFRRDSYSGDDYSLCERSVYGTPTNEPVDCKFCLRIASGGHWR